MVNIKSIEKQYRNSKIKLLTRRNNDFVEFKVHLIHRKQVLLLHGTVDILCYEGDALGTRDMKNNKNPFG